MRLRLATADDWPAIEALHERSVRQLAAESYRREVVEAWVDLDEEDGEEHGQSDDEEDAEDAHTDDVDEQRAAERPDGAESDDAADGDTDGQPGNGSRFVAVPEPDDEPPPSGGPETSPIAGFGDVRFEPPEYLSEPADGGVRAVYVDPAFAGQGVGTALLERLETEARERGLDSLGLLASVNAEGFYASHGYDAIAETTFQFGEAVEGPAVEMHTRL